MLGADAFLAAATAGPVSSILFILELTGQIGGLVAPLALAAGGAVLTMRLLERRPIYSCRIHLAWCALDGAAGPALFTAARYRDVLSAFVGHPDAASLAVVDEDGAPAGRIERSTLPQAAARLHPLSVTTARDLSDR